MSGPLTSSRPLNSYPVGGVFNIAPPAPVDGQPLAFQVDASGNLLVNVATGGGGGGVQYVDGATQATPSGTVALGKNASNVLHSLSLDASGNLNVNLANGTISGGNAAAGLTGAAVPTSADYTGFNSAGNLVGVSTANPLPVSQQGSVAVTGTFFQATQPVSIAAHVIVDQGAVGATAWKVDGSGVTQPISGSVSITGTPTVDVTDRAARLLGVVYGSQAQQLKQTAVNFNLQTELAAGGTLYDARQIRALTSTDVVTVVQPTASNLNATVVFPSAQAVTLASTTITGTVSVTQGTSPWVTADNHFPSSGALADNLANPTTTEIGANLLGWDATNSVWRRVQVDAATGTLKTDGSSVTQPVSIGGTVNVSVQNASLAVTQSTSPWVTQDAADAATGAAVPSKAIFVGANKSGNIVGLSTDASGNLNVNLAAGSISGGNAAASPTGSPVPASADYTGFNSGGNLVGVSSASPLPVTDATIAANGSNPAPTSSTQVGFLNNFNGNFVSLSGFVSGGVNALATTLVDGAGVQLAVGDNATPPDVIPVGFSVLGFDPVANKVRALTVDSSQNLKVVVASSSTVGSTGSVVPSQATYVAALVSEVPNSYVDGDFQALSLTSEGRLRVSASVPDANRIWVETFDNPFSADNSWGGSLSFN